MTGVTHQLRLDALRATNWRILRQVDVQFPDGLIGIVGRNGRGKSTLLAAILFALYGTSGVRWRKDRLVGSGPDDPIVEVEFSLGHERYRVMRQIRRRDLAIIATIERDGETISGNEAVTAEIARLIGPYDQLVVSRIVSQKQINAISALDPAPRKRMILNLLGIGVVEDAITTLRGEVGNLDKVIRTRQAVVAAIDDQGPALDQLVAERATMYRRIDGRRRAVEAARRRRDKIVAALEASEAASKAVADQATVYDFLTRQITEFDAELARISERLRGLDSAEAQLADVERRLAEIDATRGEFDALEQTAQRIRRIPDLRDELRRIETEAETAAAQIAKLQPIVDGTARLEAEIDAVTAEIERQTSELARLEAERESLRATYTRLATSIADLERDRTVATTPGAPCPTCGRPIDAPDRIAERIAAAIERAKSDQRAVTEEGRRTAAAIERLRVERERLGDRLVTLRRDLEAARQAALDLRLAEASAANLQATAAAVAAELSEAMAAHYDEARHASLAAAMEALPALLTMKGQLVASLADRARLLADVERLTANRAAVAADLDAIRAKTAAAGYDPERHAALLVEADQAQATLAAEEAQLNTLLADLRLLDDRIARAEADAAKRAKVERETNEMLQRRAVIELTKKEMERFKVGLIGRIRPALEAKASTLLRDLTDGEYTTLRLDDDYAIAIGSGSVLRDLSEVSGGEEDLANLCLRIAISELINESSGIGRTFLILDEVIGSQDDERRERILTALPSLHRHFGQVLLVAHVPGIEDRLPAIIEAEFDPVTRTSAFTYRSR
jgi:exonuclease SbcC